MKRFGFFKKPFGYIYKITNNKTKKVYIGLTRKNLNQRLREHIYYATKRKKTSKLARAIRRYGASSFEIVYLDNAKTQKGLVIKEKFYQKKYNSIEDGYNTHYGGSVGCTYGKKITVGGRLFDSIKEMCRFYNVERDTYKCRRLKGWTLEEAVGLSPHYTKSINIEGTTIKYTAVTELCSRYLVKYSTVRGIKDRENIDLEDAFRKAYYKNKQIKHGMRIMSWDPGTKNSAISVVDYSTKGKPEWIDSFMVKNLVTNMSTATLNYETINFIQDFNLWLDKYKPDMVVCELFMQRSFRSNLSSIIAYMLGIVWQECNSKGIQCELIMPSLWKNAIKKQRCKVDNFYDNSYPIAFRLPPHVVDSLLIGTYFNTNQYKCLTIENFITLFNKIKQCDYMQKWLKENYESVKQNSKSRKRNASPRKD